MTKLEILRSYSKNKIIATWKAMGSNFIDLNTKFYNEGLVYMVKLDDSEVGSVLEYMLVYCKQEFIGNVDWTSASIIDDELGYISFGNDIVSPYFILLCEYEEVPDIEGFVPFKEEFEKTGVVQISDSDYSLCLAPIGYPFITDDELEYSRENIINLAIKPALQEYFKWLPKVEIQTYSIGTSTVKNYPFPTNAYDVVHYSIQQSGGTFGSGAVTNTLWRSFEDGMYGAFNTSSLTGSYFGNTKAQTTTNSTSNYMSSRAVTQGVINYSTRTHLDKYMDSNGQKYIRIYSTKGGIAEVHWAIETLNFNDIEFAQRNNVIDFAGANVKLLFANLRKQAKGEIPGSYDYSQWVSEANETKSKILEEWKQLVKVSGIMRGGL